MRASGGGGGGAETPRKGHALAIVEVTSLTAVTQRCANAVIGARSVFAHFFARTVRPCSDCRLRALRFTLVGQ